MDAMNLSISQIAEGTPTMPEASSTEHRSLRNIRTTEMVYAVFVLAAGILLVATAV